MTPYEMLRRERAKFVLANTHKLNEYKEMTINIPEHLERYVHDQVQAGRFLTKDEVVTDALERHQASTAEARQGHQRAQPDAGGNRRPGAATPLTRRRDHQRDQAAHH